MGRKPGATLPTVCTVHMSQRLGSKRLIFVHIFEASSLTDYRLGWTGWPKSPRDFAQTHTDKIKNLSVNFINLKGNRNM